MKEHIIEIIKIEPESLEECNNTNCTKCIFYEEDCNDRRRVWRNSVPNYRGFDEDY